MINMPYGGTTPEQDTKIEDCVNRVMPTLTSKYPDAKERKSHAIAICKSSVLGKEGVKMMLENVKFRFTTPFVSEEMKIEEGAKTPECRKIKGTLLKARISRNGIKYGIEDVKNIKMTGNTISLNHTDDVTDNVGLIEKIEPIEDRVDYEGILYNTGKHPYVTDMCDKGLMKFVSIEAIAETIDYDPRENCKVAKGLELTGLGVVKTAGIPEAYMAIAEAWDKNTENINIIEDSDDAEEKLPKGDKMTDEETTNPLVANKPSEVEELKKLLEEQQKGMDALSEEIKALKEKKESKGQVTETPEKNKIVLNSKKDKDGITFWSEGLKY